MAALKFDPYDVFEVGVSYTSNLGGSDELRETINAALIEFEESEPEEGEESDEEIDPALVREALRASEVDGWGAFLTIEYGAFSAALETIAAIDRFDTGLLDDRSRKPSAWNSEIAWQPGEQWRFAGRLEGSDDLPFNPETQYGVAVLYGLSEYITLAADYLHGEFPDGEPDRDLASFQVGLRY